MLTTEKFWCYNPAKNADKVYELTLMDSPDGKFDVVAQYGRRGAKRLTFFVHAECVTKAEADKKFEEVRRTRFAHGYTTQEPV